MSVPVTVQVKLAANGTLVLGNSPMKPSCDKAKNLGSKPSGDWDALASPIASRIMFQHV